MAQTDNPIIAARRLKVDKLRAEGLTGMMIAKRLKVTRRTVVRDIAVLDRELAIEPQYTDERLKLRAILHKRSEDVWERINKIIDSIQHGGIETVVSEKDAPDKKNGKPTPARSARELYEQVMKQEEEKGKGSKPADIPKVTEITKRIFGPNWAAMAQFYKVALEWSIFEARLDGVLVDKERETVSEEIIETHGVVRLPARASEEEWQGDADAYAKGDITIAVEPEKKDDKK